MSRWRSASDSSSWLLPSCCCQHTCNLLQLLQLQMQQNLDDCCVLSSADPPTSCLLTSLALVQDKGEMVMRAYTPTSSDDELGYFDLVVKVYRANEHPSFPEVRISYPSLNIGKGAVDHIGIMSAASMP